MPRSMTGYGVARGSLSGGQLAVEIRTVNHRHLTAQLRLPSALLAEELEIRNRLRARIRRGAVTLTAQWMEEPPEVAALAVNLARAQALVDALSELKQELNLPGTIDLAFVAGQPDVLTRSPRRDITVERDELLGLVDAALDELLEMRAREGAALADDLLGVLAAIEAEAERVAERAPLRLSSERARLQRSIAELLERQPLDQDRLELEIALLADKLDISEELVRLRTHLDACRVALTDEGEVGRRLTFLGQEMLREVNTIGSKANDAEIAQSVVRLKGDLDKVREQVENLE